MLMELFDNPFNEILNAAGWTLVESYAPRKKLVLTNSRRSTMANAGPRRQDLLDQIDELQQENQDLQDQLDAIADIVSPEPDEGDEDDDDYDNGRD
jgi:hypothetical protein